MMRTAIWSYRRNSMTSMTRIEPLSIWWADVKLEMVADGEFYISKESFEDWS